MGFEDRKQLPGESMTAYIQRIKATYPVEAQASMNASARRVATQRLDPEYQRQKLLKAFSRNVEEMRGKGKIRSIEQLYKARPKSPEIYSLPSVPSSGSSLGGVNLRSYLHEVQTASKKHKSLLKDMAAYQKLYSQAKSSPGNNKKATRAQEARVDLFQKYRPEDIASAATIRYKQKAFDSRYEKYSGAYRQRQSGQKAITSEFERSLVRDVNLSLNQGQNLFSQKVDPTYAERYRSVYNTVRRPTMGSPSYTPKSADSGAQMLRDYNLDIKTYALNRGFADPVEAKKAFDTENKQSYEAQIASNRNRGGLTSFMRKVMKPMDQLVKEAVAPVVKSVSQVASVPKAVARITKAVADPVARSLVKPIGQTASSVITHAMEPVDQLVEEVVGPVLETASDSIAAIPKAVTDIKLKDIYQRMNSFEDLKKMPGRMEDVFEKFQNKITDDVIPHELKDIYQRMNSFEDLKKMPGRMEGVLQKFQEKITDDVIPKEFEEVYRKLNSFDDFKRTVIPREFTRINQLEKSIEQAIPNEFRDVYKKLNSLDDIKDQVGSKLQKVIDIIPGLGMGGLLASRRDVRKAEEAAAAARKAQEEAMMSEWDKKLRDMDDLWQSQSAKLASDMEGMFAAQEASAKRAALKSERAMMSSRISGIRSMRDLKQTKLDTALGLSGASGESGMGTLARASAQITGRRSGKRAKFSGAAIPTLRVGSEYRPM